MTRRKIQLDNIKTSKEGFTLVEVMLALGIAGLLLIGVMSGTYSSIKTQRYNDALRSFAEYMRTVYSEVISPQSLGFGNSKNQAILGKVLVFGENADDSTVYSATIVGKADIPIKVSTTETFLDSLAKDEYEIALFCGKPGNEEDSWNNSTVSSYVPLWQAELRQANDPTLGTSFQNKFKGTMIIARALTSATVHTAFLENVTYDLENGCTKINNSASSQFRNDLKDYSKRSQYEETLDRENYIGTGICVKTAESAVSREVRIAADGRNTSAVHIMDDNEENRCH